MWLMSMRGRPRSWRMMEGYPINTFRFVNAEGKATFVRFIWKPKLGVHGLLLNEANIIGGVDPDFHRHDLIEAIERGAYPEYDFGVQLIPEEDEFKYDFDLLDATKIWPEEQFPFQIIGKLTLNRLVENFFAEEEQSSFDPSNVVPGIEFSHDPVLQGRTFAYRDTDYHRLGTGNIEEIPINQPIVATNYNQRDSYSRYRIDVDPIHYHGNSLAGNTPSETTAEEGGYVHYPTKVEGEITRQVPSDLFSDHFSQARLFWNSMSPAEQKDLVSTFVFHLGKVKSKDVRQQNVEMFANVDKEFAAKVAERIGVNPPQRSHVPVSKSSPVLSMGSTIYTPYTQKVGVLMGNGFDDEEVRPVFEAMQQNGVFFEVISEKLGTVTGMNGLQVEVNETCLTTYPVLYDSLYIVGGTADMQGKFDMDVQDFVNTAYKFFKPIGIATSGEKYKPNYGNLAGVISAAISDNFPRDFIDAVGRQRYWERVLVQQKDLVQV